MSEWIPVSKRLPEGDVEVLVVSAAGEYEVYPAHSLHALYLYEIDINEDHAFTHWMPLPEPPKG